MVLMPDSLVMEAAICASSVQGFWAHQQSPPKVRKRDEHKITPAKVNCTEFCISSRILDMVVKGNGKGPGL